MRVAVFSTKPYDRTFLERANRHAGHEFVFLEAHLAPETAQLAAGCNAVCLFVNDNADAATIAALAGSGVHAIVLRCAGFNRVDLAAARDNGIVVGRVPDYSPYAIAEHALALILSLSRKIHKAYARVREGNFALDGLLGSEVHGRTIGVIGTGRIGLAFARIMTGFGCPILAMDPYPNPQIDALGGRYVDLDTLLGSSDIVSIHCPLTPETRHLIDDKAVAALKPGAMVINTSRGAVIDTKAIIACLKSGRVGSLVLDVYEEEVNLFFENLSDQLITDDTFARLLTFPNVLITGHQGFFTRQAMEAIARTTIGNLSEFEKTGAVLHEVSVERLAGS